MKDFQVGTCYSRDEISSRVGGSRRDALPLRQGCVVAGCFKRMDRYNPGAPHEVTIGPTRAQRPLRAAQILFAQAQPIPVFVWEHSAAWRFDGYFHCVGFCQRQGCMDRLEYENPDRKGIVAVLDLQPAAR